MVLWTNPVGNAVLVAVKTYVINFLRSEKKELNNLWKEVRQSLEARHRINSNKRTGRFIIKDEVFYKREAFISKVRILTLHR